MNEQVKEFKEQLKMLVGKIQETTGATEVRVNLQSTRHGKETRIDLEYSEFEDCKQGSVM